MQINSYTSKGNKAKSIIFPKEWQEEANDVLLAQAIRVYEARKHPGLSKVKTRGEVAHSTRKIYKQKGTGSARHGDRGAPIFVKGGIAHGPKGIKRTLHLPKKMRQKALKIALTEKAKQGLLLVLDNILKIKSTKEAANLIKTITGKEKGVEEKSRFTFVLSSENKGAALFLRNIKNVNIVFARNLNTYDVFYGGVLIVDKDALIRIRKSKNTKVKVQNKAKKAKPKTQTRTKKDK